jgi:hypothetical protein
VPLLDRADSTFVVIDAQPGFITQSSMSDDEWMHTVDDALQTLREARTRFGPPPVRL